jgi:hypothetical protein
MHLTLKEIATTHRTRNIRKALVDRRVHKGVERHKVLNEK